MGISKAGTQPMHMGNAVANCPSLGNQRGHVPANAMHQLQHWPHGVLIYTSFKGLCCPHTTPAHGHGAVTLAKAPCTHTYHCHPPKCHTTRIHLALRLMLNAGWVIIGQHHTASAMLIHKGLIIDSQMLGLAPSKSQSQGCMCCRLGEGTGGREQGAPCRPPAPIGLPLIHLAIHPHPFKAPDAFGPLCACLCSPACCTQASCPHHLTTTHCNPPTLAISSIMHCNVPSDMPDTMAMASLHHSLPWHHTPIIPMLHNTHSLACKNTKVNHLPTFTPTMPSKML